MSEDFNGIERCAMCGGEPIFRIRFSHCYCKCTICGNGFEVYKGDFETNPANKSDKRYELIAMWNAKQSVNIKLMKANDWKQADEYSSGLEEAIVTAVKTVGEEVKAHVDVKAEELYQRGDANTVALNEKIGEKIDNLFTPLDEVLADLEEEEDPAQAHIEDFATEEEPVAEHAPHTVKGPVEEPVIIVEEPVVTATTTSEEPVVTTYVESVEDKKDAIEMMFGDDNKYSQVGTKPYEPVIDDVDEDTIPEPKVIVEGDVWEDEKPEPRKELEVKPETPIEKAEEPEKTAEEPDAADKNSESTSAVPKALESLSAEDVQALLAFLKNKQ